MKVCCAPMSAGHSNFGCNLSQPVLFVCQMLETKPLLIRPAIFQGFAEVAAGQSTRHGGVSPAPWHSLNLGKSTDDNPANVSENRQRFCAQLGFDPAQMAWSKQVHGDRIRLAGEPGGAEGFDALVSATPGVLLAVSVADCTPILLYDRAHSVVAAIHAGWKGTVARLVARTLEFMHSEFGTEGEFCFAYVGACIDECSFEVGEDVGELFEEGFRRFDRERGKFFVDLKNANASQCLDFGIPPTQLEISPFCTVQHNDHFFSHRREKGVTGRGMAAIGLRSVNLMK